MACSDTFGAASVFADVEEIDALLNADALGEAPARLRSAPDDELDKT
jgi:hypothetical protein